jgi:phage-related minor tail protein
VSTLSTLVVKLVGEIGPFVTSMEKGAKAAKRAGEDISGSLNNAMSKIGNVAMIGAGAVVAAGAAIGGAALKAAMDLDEAYDTIAIGTGETGKVLEGLKADFDKVFTSIPTDAGPAADVIAELNTRLGITGPALTNLTTPLLEMTRLLGGDAKNNAALFSRVVGDWNIPLEDSAASLDMIFLASQKTGIGVDKLMEKVVQFGSPLRLMGFSLDESVAMLGKWEQEGVNTELVLGSLRIAAGKFAKENIPLREGLMNSIEQIKNMKDSSAALTKGMQVFGAKAGPDMVAAIREGRFELGDLVTALQNADGAIMDAAESTADFPEKLKVMGNKAIKALAPLGMAIMDGISKGLDTVGPVVEAVLPKVIEVFTTVGEWVSTNIGPVFEAVTRNIQDVIVWVQQNWPQIRQVIEDTWEKIRARVEPALKAVAAVISAVFGAISKFVAEHGEEIKQFISDTWEGIRAIVEPVITWFYTAITTVFGGIAAWINENQSEVQRIIEGVWNGIKMFVGTVLDVIRGIVNAVLALLRGDWQGAWDAIRNAVESIWDRIKGTVGQAVETMRMIIFIVADKIKTAWDNFWGGVRQTIDNIWQGILGFLEGAVNGVIDIINGMVDAFNSTIGRVTGEIPKLEKVALTTKDNLTKVMDSANDDVGNSAGEMSTVIAKMVNNVTSTIKSDAPGMLDPFRKEVRSTADQVRIWVNQMIDLLNDLIRKATGIDLGLGGSSGASTGGAASSPSPVQRAAGAAGRVAPGSLASAASASTIDQSSNDVWNIRTDAAGLALLQERQRIARVAEMQARM